MAQNFDKELFKKARIKNFQKIYGGKVGNVKNSS